MSLAHGVLLPGFSGTTLPAWVAEALASGLQGVVLFAENVPDVATARTLTDEVRSVRAAAVVASDEEGGDVTRLQAATGSSIPGNAALGVVDETELTQAVARAYGVVISLAGIDLALGPCLDICSEPLNPVVGVRSFGATADLVGRHGRAFVGGLREAGVASCGKHFPGHGATKTDSHVGLPTLDVTAQALRAREQRPFAAAKADAVMTAHVVVPEVGEEPATLSAWAYRDIRALGFGGPVLTDALGMRAITDRLEMGEACVRALEAGADLLLLDAPHMRDAEQDFRRAVEAIERAVAEGRLREETLRESAARNVALRRPKPTFTADRLAAAMEALESLGQRVARQALVTSGDIDLRGEPAVIDVRRSLNHASGSIYNPLFHAFAAEGLDVVSDDPLGSDVQPVVLTRQALSDPKEAEQLDAVLRARPDAIVVHGGVAAAAPRAARLICMHGVGAVNARAAVRAMRSAAA